MKYEVIIKPSVFKDLDKLPKQTVEALFAAIETLVENPRPYGYKKLENAQKIESKYKSLFRIRVGDYRIVYAVEDKIITITVVRIRHRSKVYK